MKNLPAVLTIIIGSIFTTSVFLYKSYIPDSNYVVTAKTSNNITHLKNLECEESNVCMESDITEINEDFKRLVKYIKNTEGDYALSIKNIKTNETLNYNQNVKIPAASLYKIPIAIDVLNTEVTNETINDVSTLIDNSDNNMQIYLQNIYGINYDFISKNFNEDNITTSSEIVRLLSDFNNNKLLNKKNTNILKTIMSKTIHDIYINSGLSYKNVFSHKVGLDASIGIYNDCGILDEKVIICLMSKNTTVEDFKDVSKRVGLFASNF